MTRVLVTGATGYIGIHCVQQLLKQQYLVRGTVRNPDNEEKMKPLKSLEGSERLELMKADLDHDDYWNEVVQGCDYILHVASPFVINDDDSIIKTAVDGTLRVLRAAQQSSSVKKIVQTSSIVAINEGHANPDKLMNENDWTNVDSSDVKNYSRSKTLAEKAAWDFMRDNKDIHFKLTCINPVFVVGPALQEERGTSTMIIKHFLDGRMPAYPAVQLALVDVRDVATAHIKAMCEPRTDGERILIASQSSLWFREIAKILRDEFGSQGYSVPRFQAPYPLVWLHSIFNEDSRQILMRIGHKVNLDNAKAKNLLGMDFIDPKESLITMVYDMIERGVLPKKAAYRGRRTQDFE